MSSVDALRECVEVAERALAVLELAGDISTDDRAALAGVVRGALHIRPAIRLVPSPPPPDPTLAEYVSVRDVIEELGFVWMKPGHRSTAGRRVKGAWLRMKLPEGEPPTRQAALPQSSPRETGPVAVYPPVFRQRMRQVITEYAQTLGHRGAA